MAIGLTLSTGTPVAEKPPDPPVTEGTTVTQVEVGNTAGDLVQATSETVAGQGFVGGAVTGVVFGLDTIRPIILQEIEKIKEISRDTRPDFEVFARNYVADAPKMLFVADYVVQEKVIGALVVWEDYSDSTHYEVFRKNLFQSGAIFERILFLDKQSLEEERTRLFPYVTDILGITSLQESKVFLMNDTKVGADRIYQYKISAVRIPESAADVDYDMILISKNIVSQVSLESSSTLNIFDFAEVNLGSRDLAWVISLMNDANAGQMRFFARGALQNALVNLEPLILDGVPTIFSPRSLVDIMCVIQESAALFGFKPTMGHLIDVIGGLDPTFRTAFLDSIDANEVFSFDLFRDIIRNEAPQFDIVLDISESGDEQAIGELSNLSITVPTEEGVNSLASIEDLSIVFKFVNDFLIATFYAQDNFLALQVIKAGIAQRQLQISVATIDQAIIEAQDVGKTTQQPNIIEAAVKSVLAVLGIALGDIETDVDELDEFGGLSFLFDIFGL